MLVVVSPAKKLNMQSSSNLMSSRPIFSHNVNELVSKMQALSVDELKKTMGSVSYTHLTLPTKRIV